MPMASRIAMKLAMYMVAAQAASGAAFGVASVLVHEEAFDRPHDIELYGDIALVPGKGGSLAAVDIADPAAPQLLWHRHQPEELHDAETVLVLEDNLYLGTNDFLRIGLEAEAPGSIAARVTTEPPISAINGMVRRGNIVLAAGKNGVLAAYNVGDPLSPRAVGALDLRAAFGLRTPHDIDRYGDFVAVPDGGDFSRTNIPGQLALVRVFDERSGALLPPDDWTCAGKVANAALAGANRVHVAGDYAYVGASTSAQGGNLVAIDISDPSHPRQSAALPFAPEDGWGPNGLTIAGNIIFAAGGQSVEAFDITRPDQPVKVASQRFPEILANASVKPGRGDSAHDLVFRDGYLYVTGQNDHCLLILAVDQEKLRVGEL